jgi:hypothetical protein
MAKAGSEGRDKAPNLMNVLHTVFSQFMIADFTDSRVAVGAPPEVGVVPFSVFIVGMNFFSHVLVCLKRKGIGKVKGKGK